RSLQEAFIGKVLDGGQSVLSGQPTSVQGVQTAQPSQPTDIDTNVIPNNVKPVIQSTQAEIQKRAQHEDESLRQVQQQIQRYAQRHGFAQNIRTTIDQRGLVIRLLTDHVLFDSGQAMVKPAAVPLLGHVTDLILHAGVTNPIRVEGHTDDVPIASAVFHSNWELSAARAA